MAKHHENAQSTKWLHYQFLPVSIFLVYKYEIKECDFPPVCPFPFFNPLWSVYRVHLIIPLLFPVCKSNTRETYSISTVIFLCYFSFKIRENLEVLSGLRPGGRASHRWGKCFQQGLSVWRAVPSHYWKNMCAAGQIRACRKIPEAMCIQPPGRWSSVRVESQPGQGWGWLTQLLGRQPTAGAAGRVHESWRELGATGHLCLCEVC